MIRSFIANVFLSLGALSAQAGVLCQTQEVQEKIVNSLSLTLIGKSQVHPLLILIGGYVSSGKTTLSSALKEQYGITVFSLNAIRQAMLDEQIDIRTNKQEERKILFEVYPRLLAPCIANQQHVVIDANANQQGIQDALKFLRENEGGSTYRIVKIHLRASEEELYRRVRARIPAIGLHQGTEADLAYELNTPTKVIHPKDYDLVINTEETPFEVEMELVMDFLKPYFSDLKFNQ